MNTATDNNLAHFVTQERIRFAHCDPAGIVFFPRYAELINGLVEDWWRALGFPWSQTVREQGLGCPTVQFDMQFVAPSFLDETVQLRLSVTRLGTSSLQLQHEITGTDATDVRVRVQQVVVCTDLTTHQSRPWPPIMAQKINEFMSQEERP